MSQGKSPISKLKDVKLTIYNHITYLYIIIYIVRIILDEHNFS